MSDRSYRQAKASVYVGSDDAAWIVTETPSEVVDEVRSANSDDLIKLTLGNRSDWNGKPLYVRAGAITSISPPRDDETEDES